MSSPAAPDPGSPALAAAPPAAVAALAVGLLLPGLSGGSRPEYMAFKPSPEVMATAQTLAAMLGDGDEFRDRLAAELSKPASMPLYENRHGELDALMRRSTRWDG